MECGELCVTMVGITMMLELCADNWGTMSTQVRLSSFWEKIGTVAKDQSLSVFHRLYMCKYSVMCGYCSRLLVVQEWHL